MTVLTTNPPDRPLLEPGMRPLLKITDVDSLPREIGGCDVDYELDNGRLIIVVPPGDSHGSTQANIVTELKIQGERRGHGKARTEVGVVLWRDPDRLLGTDVVFIAAESLPIKKTPEGYIDGAPDLAVEVRSKNDSWPFLQRKVEDYLTAGSKVVWVADPETRTIKVYQGQETKTLNADDTLTLDMIPDFSVRVGVFFEE